MPNKNLDPYDVLGVPRDADAAMLSRAYRRKAKATHPDSGGNPEAFGAVKQAHLVLSDPVLRARFDATGEMGDTGPDLIDQAAMNMISDMLRQALTVEEQPTSVDILTKMRQTLDQNRQQIDGEIATARKTVAKAETIRGRFKRKRGRKPAENVLERMVAWQIEQMKLPIAGMEEAKRIRTRALEMLEDYTFRMDERQQMVFVQHFAFGTASTSTTSTG